ncbi:hypothetical protein N9H93_00905 [Rhizobiaceae bacterium]|nr:hypothetical protein [Rhizobiaceae bacterium]
MTDAERDDARPLRKAIAVVKDREADRTDVVVDLGNAERARLELLAAAIRPLLDEIDTADDRFEFAITRGTKARLWIDMVAFVSMGNDKRTYRLLRDTRQGRVVLSETGDLDVARDAVTNYVAERIVERSKMLDADWDARPLSPNFSEEDGEFGREQIADDLNSNSASLPAPTVQQPETCRARRILWFVIGMTVGALALAAIVIFGSPRAL